MYAERTFGICHPRWVSVLLCCMPVVAGVRINLEEAAQVEALYMHRLGAHLSFKSTASHSAASALSFGTGKEWGLLTYGIAVLGVVGLVTALYMDRSTGEKVSIIVYLLALSSVRLAVKAVFVQYHFNFPLAVSAMHFVLCGIAAFAVLIYRRKVPLLTSSEFFLVILPIAVSFATCIGVGNKVLDLCSIAFTEILMATQPVMSIPVVLLLGMPFDTWLFLPTLLVVVGCIICSLGDLNFSLLGLALVVLSNALRAVKASLQQKMLTGEKKEKFNPCALLAWVSIPSAVLMFAWSAAVEGAGPIERLAQDPQRWHVVGAVVLSAIPATLLNLSQLFVVAGLGAVGSQIVAQLKIVLTILGGVVLLGESVGPLQVAGFLLVVVGTFFYSRWEHLSKQQQQQKQQKEQQQQQQQLEDDLRQACLQAKG